MSESKPAGRLLLLPGLQPEEEILKPIVGELIENVYSHPNGYRDSYGSVQSLQNTVAAMVDLKGELDFEEYVQVLEKVTDMAISFAERYHVLMSSLPPSMRGDCTMSFQRMVGPDLLVCIVPPRS